LRNSEVDELFQGTTFGMEYDCPEADRTVTLPDGNQFCTREYSTHSIHGVGTDPLGEFNLFSGELQIKPCNSEELLLSEIDKVLRVACPGDRAGWHTSIHMHVRIPALIEQVDLLRQISAYTSAHWHLVHPYLFKMEEVENDPYCKWVRDSAVAITGGVYDEAALWRGSYAETSKDLALAMHLRHEGDHVEAWKNEFSLHKGNVQRPAVNFSHLAMPLQTIEFRCFTATFDRSILRNIIEFPLQWIRAALMFDPDPAKIVRGKQWQDRVHMPTSNKIIAERTTLYHNDREQVCRNIEAQLISGNLTLADLNYPKYWIDKGYE